MKPLDTVRDLLQLPRYWAHSATARKRMTARVTRVPYGRRRRRQYFLLLEPLGSQSTDPLPWAVYFHGGAWTFGTPEAFRPAARPWLAAGFRVVLPSYRRPPTVHLAGIVADCRAVIAAVAAFARQSGRPLLPVQVGGISAGGHLAALTALAPDWWTQTGWPAAPARALICAAPLDLALIFPSRLFRGYRRFNPAQLVAAAPAVDWQLVHGTADGMVDYGHSQRFIHLAEAHGHPCRLHTLSGGGHLDAGRWTYDDRNPVAALVAAFVTPPPPPGPAPRAPG